MVEHFLAKEDVASSSLVTRSNPLFVRICGRFGGSAKVPNANTQRLASQDSPYRLQWLDNAGTLTMRISRGNQIIGEWSSVEVNERLESGDLLLTDTFYDEDKSDWPPLSELSALQAKRSSVKVQRPCYCGSGLPFQVCCRDGDC